MSAELKEVEAAQDKLNGNRKNSMIAIRDLEQTKERIPSFAKYAEAAQPKVLVLLIQTVVERIYIVDKDDERFCHIFIKSCIGEDYTSFFRATGYIATDIIPENGVRIAFAPKYRRKVVYKELRTDTGQIIKELCEEKKVEILEAKFI